MHVPFKFPSARCAVSPVAISATPLMDVVPATIVTADEVCWALGKAGTSSAPKTAAEVRAVHWYWHITVAQPHTAPHLLNSLTPLHQHMPAAVALFFCAHSLATHPA
jgi:hypothetical protein